MAKREAIEQWSHLSCVDHPELDGREEEFLIRSDMAHLLILLEVRRGRVDEPIAHRPSPLGEPSLEMQPNDYAKRSMLTFLR